MKMSQPPSTSRITASCTFRAMRRLLIGPNFSRSDDTQAGKNVNASVCGTANSITSCPAAECPRNIARVLCSACSISSDCAYSVSPAGVRRVGYELRSTRSVPAHASSAWMRREKAGCVTCRNCAERLKLRVSARLTKSSSHLVSTASLLPVAFARAHAVVEHDLPLAARFLPPDGVEARKELALGVVHRAGGPRERAAAD